MRGFIGWCKAASRAEATFLPRAWLPLLFLLCAGLTGIFVLLLTPIGEAPDEPQHVSRADGLLSGQILGIHWHGSATAGVMMNAALFAATIIEIDNRLDQPLPDAARRQARAVRWNDHRFGVARVYCTTQMVRYFPAFYLPAALGILAGRTLRITPLHSLFLGRGFMLLSFLGMGAAALHFARFGQPLLFTVLLLPMTLYLASSFNLDGQMIGAAALAASLLTRPLPGPNRRWLVALLLLTMIACAKAPYIWLLLACLPPFTRDRLFPRVALVTTAAALPVLWLWATSGVSNWPWPRPPYHPGPLWPHSRAVWLTATSVPGNLAVLLTHPIQIIWLPLHAFMLQEPAIWHQMIGSIGWSIGMPRIGWLGPALPRWEYAGWLVAAIAATLATIVKKPAAPLGWATGYYVLLLVATVLSISLSAYVTFTNVGLDRIDGLQGRYFEPVLPFLIFVLPLAARLRRRQLAEYAAAVPMAAYCLPAVTMAALQIYTLPAQIFNMFRMAGP